MTALADLDRIEQVRARIDHLADGGDLGAAAALAAEGAEASARLGDHAGTAVFGVSQGILLADDGRFVEAAPLIERWLPEVGDAPSMVAAAHRALARCHQASGDYRPASLAFLDAAIGFKRTEQWVPYLGALVEALESVHRVGEKRLDPDGEIWEEAMATSERMVASEPLARLRAIGPRPGRSVGGLVRRALYNPTERFHVRFDEAQLAANEGRMSEARKWLSQMIEGIPHLSAAGPVRRVHLLMLLSRLLGESCVLDGDYASAFHSTTLGEVIALDNIDDLHDDTLLATISFLSVRATIHQALGNTDDARSLMARCVRTSDRLREPGQRVEAYRAIGIGAVPPDDRLLLDRAVALAPELDGHPLLADVYLDRAKVEPDSSSRLALLDRALVLVPAGVAHYGHDPVVLAGVQDRVRVVEAMRLEALTAVDPDEGKREFDRMMSTMSASAVVPAALMMLAARRLGDLRRAVPLAVVASSGIADQLDAVLGLGHRSEGFAELEESWTVALDVLSNHDAHGPDHPAARQATLRLVEAANRGALNFVHDRGLSRSRLVDAGGSPDDLYRRAAEARRSPADPGPAILDALRGRVGLTFVVLEHVPEERLRIARVMVGHEVGESAGDSLDVESFELTGDALQFVESGVWGSLPTGGSPHPAWVEASRLLLGRTVVGAVDDGVPLSIVVAPGSSALSTVPWAGLHTGRCYLAEVADVQITPALGALGSDRADPAEVRPPPVPAALVFGPQLDIELERERDALSRQHRWPTTDASTEADLLLALKRPGIWAFGHFATHGAGLGRDQRLLIENGVHLDVSAAMGLWWPSITMFGACEVGQFGATPGEEPFGLPFACLLRGAEHVIGPVTNVASGGTADLSVAIIAALADGTQPVRAVANAQRWMIANLPDADLNAWAAMQVVSLA
ncbi:MAG: CHAT domain-containing protein [Actinomycetota bacterium]